MASNRSGMRAEVTICGTVEAQMLFVRVERKYVYDRQNVCQHTSATPEVRLRDARLAVALDDPGEWGAVWAWLFDLVMVLQQGKPRVILARIDALDGEAGVLLQALARTVLWELGIMVVEPWERDGQLRLPLEGEEG